MQSLAQAIYVCCLYIYIELPRVWEMLEPILRLFLSFKSVGDTITLPMEKTCRQIFHLKEEYLISARRQMSSFPPSDGDELALVLEKIQSMGKIEIGYRPCDQMLLGLKFYAKDGAVVLQTKYDWVANGYFKTNMVHLEDGERVIGYKSRSNPLNPNCALHCSFGLIIGRQI